MRLCHCIGAVPPGAHRAGRRTLEHPTEGTLRLAANPIQMAACPPSIRRLPPRLGEHTAEVLREHGFKAETIERLAGGWTGSA